MRPDFRYAETPKLFLIRSGNRIDNRAPLEGTILTHCEASKVVKSAGFSNRTALFLRHFFPTAILLLVPLLCLGGGLRAQSNFSLLSPDGKIEVRVHVDSTVNYDVLLSGTPLLQNSTLSL